MNKYIKCICICLALVSFSFVITTIEMGCKKHWIQNNQITVFEHSESVDHLTQLFVTAGLPENLDPNRSISVLTNHGYLVGYCESLKNPIWVAYRIGKTKTPLDSARANQFLTDTRTTSKVSDEDYRGSGFDRGHMAPNFAIKTNYGKLAQLETFLMTNISPQTAKLNRSIWRKLEHKVAAKYAQDLSDIWVITGPIFDDDPPKMHSGVSIPHSFYKIVVNKYGIRDSGLETLAFIFPQEVDNEKPLDDYLVSIDEIEKLTDLNFFALFGKRKQRNMESSAATSIWAEPYKHN